MQNLCHGFIRENGVYDFVLQCKNYMCCKLLENAIFLSSIRLFDFYMWKCSDMNYTICRQLFLKLFQDFVNQLSVLHHYLF